MKLQSVLHRHIAGIATYEESILLMQVSFIRQSCLALIIYIGNTIAHHLHQSLANLVAADMHAHTVRLHHGCRTIAVYHQSRQIVALAMHQSICIVGRTVGYTYTDTNIECRLQTLAPEVGIDLYILEGKHTYSDRAYLVMTYGYKLARGCDDSYRLAFLDALVHVMNGT